MRNFKERWQKSCPLILNIFFFAYRVLSRKELRYSTDDFSGKHGISSWNLSKVNGNDRRARLLRYRSIKLTVAHEMVLWQWGIIHMYKYSSDRLTCSCMSPNDSGFTVRLESMESNDNIIYSCMKMRRRTATRGTLNHPKKIIVISNGHNSDNWGVPPRVTAHSYYPEFYF